MKQLWLAIGTVMVILLLDHFSVAAATLTGTIVFNCVGFRGDGITTFNRDNTGRGEEAYDITVTDGTGVVLFNYQGAWPVGGIVGFTAGVEPYQTLPKANPIRLVFTSLAGNGLPAETVIDVSGACVDQPTMGTPCIIHDGRINNLPGKDCGSPVAIYCSEAGLDVYIVNPDTGEGTLALRSSKADLDIPVNDHNQTIIAKSNIILSRLSTGEYQLNAVYGKENKPYIFVWDQCPSRTKAYHLAN